MGVPAYKIGSGECNNYPLIDHIAAFGKPVILSTGMNDLRSIEPAVAILRRAARAVRAPALHLDVPDSVRQGPPRRASRILRARFPTPCSASSDHSLGNYTCFAAVALGASILEKHFTSDKTWPGPDVPISIDPRELGELVRGTRAIIEALGGSKEILPEEQPTIDFAYACVVSDPRHRRRAKRSTGDNVWVKRPGTGEIKAAHYEGVIGKVALRDIARDTQIRRADIG